VTTSAVERWSSPAEKDEAALERSLRGEPLPLSVRGLCFDRRLYRTDRKERPGVCRCGQPARPGTLTCSPECALRRKKNLKNTSKRQRSAHRRFERACEQTFHGREEWRTWLAGKIKGQRLSVDDPRLEAVAYRFARACRIAALIDYDGRIVACGKPHPEAAEKAKAFIDWRWQQQQMREQEQDNEGPVA